MQDTQPRPPLNSALATPPGSPPSAQPRPLSASPRERLIGTAMPPNGQAIKQQKPTTNLKQAQVANENEIHSHNLNAKKKRKYTKQEEDERHNKINKKQQRQQKQEGAHKMIPQGQQ